MDGQARGSNAARRAAAHKYRSDQIRLLLVAEAPPTSLDRYFYFEDVSDQDSLFRYVVRVLLGAVPNRHDKPIWLSRLRDAGVFLIDLSEDPYGTSVLKTHVADCVLRCRELMPTKIVLIKVTVYDTMFAPLKAAGLPVIDCRIPFPGSGQQSRFEVLFTEALNVAGLDLPILSIK